MAAQPQLVEPCDLLLGKCLVGEVGQRRPTPKAKRVAEDSEAASACPWARAAPRLHQAAPGSARRRVAPGRPEGRTQMDASRRDSQRRLHRHASFRDERSAQLRDVALDAASRRSRRRLAPDPSIRRSVETTSLACTSSRASRAAGFPRRFESGRSPLETSNGPSTRNSMADRSKLDAERTTSLPARHLSTRNRPELHPSSTVARPAALILRRTVLHEERSRR